MEFTKDYSQNNETFNTPGRLMIKGEEMEWENDLFGLLGLLLY